ncbi:MAG TPA: hypothetical protein VK588_03000 [Chitinophagaceae bacterium]|nr:hypothetical protein [Chitinophagaceae bacterium]
MTKIPPSLTLAKCQILSSTTSIATAETKKYGFVIFANLDLLEVEKLIRTKLIWGEWFYADEWGLPELFSDWIDFGVDPTWYEFEGLEYTNEAQAKVILNKIY